MTLDDIQPNETLQLTAQIARLFKLAGCDPTCHCCREEIVVGDFFKLQTYNVQRTTNTTIERHERDIMLCADCDTIKLAAREKNHLRRRAKWLRENPRAGYSRPTRKRE